MRLFNFLLLVSSLVLSQQAFADWSVNTKKSAINFVATKNYHLSENYHFRNFAGVLTNNGQFTLEIQLASIDSLIPLRDERLKEFLFKVGQFPTATINAKISPTLLKSINSGDSQLVELDADLSLAGVNQLVKINALITKSSNGSIVVTSSQAVLVNATSFNFVPGLEKLQKLASAKHIAQTIALNFVLTLK